MGEGVSLSLPRKWVPSSNLLSPVSALIFVSLTRDHVCLCERNFYGVLNSSDTEIYTNGEAMVFPGTTRGLHTQKWVSPCLTQYRDVEDGAKPIPRPI